MSKHRRQRMKRIRKAAAILRPVPAGTYTLQIVSQKLDLETHGNVIVQITGVILEHQTRNSE